MAHPDERNEMTLIEVELAQGTSTATPSAAPFVFGGGGLEPIIPLGLLVERGYKVFLKASSLRTLMICLLLRLALWLRQRSGESGLIGAVRNQSGHLRTRPSSFAVLRFDAVKGRSFSTRHRTLVTCCHAMKASNHVIKHLFLISVCGLFKPWIVSDLSV